MYIILLATGRTYLTQGGSTSLKSKARTFLFKCHAKIIAKAVNGTVLPLEDKDGV